MGYFAEIDNGKVIQVAVFDGSISECVEFFGSGTWEALAHKSEAGIGYDKDEEHDTFVPPKPYPSWQINDTYNGWNPPAKSTTLITDGTRQQEKKNPLMEKYMTGLKLLNNG
jgi:hypothetical protein